MPASLTKNATKNLSIGGHLTGTGLVVTEHVRRSQTRSTDGDGTRLYRRRPDVTNKAKHRHLVLVATQSRRTRSETAPGPCTWPGTAPRWAETPGIPRSKAPANQLAIAGSRAEAMTLAALVLSIQAGSQEKKKIRLDLLASWKLSRANGSRPLPP